MIKTLVVSFIYPEVELYLKDFFQSLNKQTTNEFDSLIFNDGLNINLQKFNYYGKMINNIKNLGIIESRKYVINYSIKNNYDLLIFADADDVLSYDRVETIINSYEKDISFFYNDLYLLNKSVDFYEGKLPNKVTNYKNILKYNYLGMSHTAINIFKERNNLLRMKIDKNLVAFDWYLHSFILVNGGIGKKVNTKTYYRLHNKNIAGSSKYLTEEKLLNGLKVKKNHYKMMRNYKKEYQILYKNILELEKYLNQSNKDKYIDSINKRYDNVFWWENIRTLDEIRKDGYSG